MIKLKKISHGVKQQLVNSVTNEQRIYVKRKNSGYNVVPEELK